MWAALVIVVAFVAAIAAFAGWVFAVPLGLIGLGLVWYASAIRKKRGVEGVDRLREEARGAAPLDKGGVEFTDKDRETLSS